MTLTGIFDQQQKRNSGIQGVIVGIVTNNKDPEDWCRVKVKLPGICDDDESNWARVVSFMAGKERGALFLPEVDDEVLVAFEGGDINRPYILGSLWNGKDLPPENNSSGKNNLRMIKSRSGHLIKLDDSDGKEKVEIIDKSGKNMITIDTKENKITIDSSQDMELLAKKGKLTIEAKEIEIKSSAKAKIETKEIEIKSSADAKFDITGNLNLEAKGETTIKGSMINLN